MDTVFGIELSQSDDVVLLQSREILLLRSQAFDVGKEVSFDDVSEVLYEFFFVEYFPFLSARRRRQGCRWKWFTEHIDLIRRRRI